MNGPTKARATMREVLRRVYHASRNLPDRMMHRRRHAAIRRRLSAALPPRRILVVCYGNVCRSPYLEAVLRRALPSVTLASAGFVGADRPVPAASALVSTRRGIDLSTFRSRPLTAAAVNSADLVIVMDLGQARELMVRYPITSKRIIIAGDLDPRFDASRGIRDPWNRSSDVFESCFDRLDRCAATLVSLIQPRIAGLGRRDGSDLRTVVAPSVKPTIAVAKSPHFGAF